MIHPLASWPRRVGRGIPSTRRTLTTLSGLAAFLTAAIGLTPAASATHVPPGPPVPAPPAPPLAPATAAAAHFPLWAVIAIVAATVVLSVATTLVTLSLEHMHRARRGPAVAPGPQASAPAASAKAESGAGPATVAGGHQSPQTDQPPAYVGR
jgi:hypothetical protein